MNNLTRMNTKSSTIKTAYESVIESVIAFHLHIIYGHMTKDMRCDLDGIICTANKLSNNQLSCKTIEEFHNARLKNKCLRIYLGDDPPTKHARAITNRSLPHTDIPCGLRIFWFRTKYARLVNNRNNSNVFHNFYYSLSILYYSIFTITFLYNHFVSAEQIFPANNIFYQI